MVHKTLDGVDPAERNASSGFVPTMRLQKLVVEKLVVSAGTVTAVFSADTATPALKKSVEGRVVNGHAILPLAVFCDMALTGTRHCHSRLVHGSNLEGTWMTLQDMLLTKAVVLAPGCSPVVLVIESYTRSSPIKQAMEKGNRVLRSAAAGPPIHVVRVGSRCGRRRCRGADAVDDADAER